MVGLFLQALGESSVEGAEAAGVLAGLLGAILVFFLIFFLISLAIYVYISFAFMAIARRAGQSLPGLAWIPGVGGRLICTGGRG